MSFDPIKVTKAIGDSYLDYLSTSFPLHDHNLQEQFVNLLKEPGKFIKGPILEATPPFKKGATISELIAEGLLSREFIKLQSSSFKLDRNLYQHQELALRKIIEKQRNIVLATGTGSGKTEAFLLPILDYLFKEKEAGRLGPGVRALLLYPMNALANDQLTRLREILAEYKDITFGRYTGETERDDAKALEKHVKMFGCKNLDNELISRSQMWQSPPHILLTNYAMLEYLLLRPEDSVFFDGDYAKHWRFLVLDEAHTYMGAKGIETSMLVRRLKDRVKMSQPGRLRCIATSATLGGGEDDFPAVADFAQQLFGEAFEFDINNPDKQDIIGATRLQLAQTEDSWGALDPEDYLRCKDIIDRQKADNGDNDSKDISKDIIDRMVTVLDGKVPEYLLDRAYRRGGTEGWPTFLYEILKGEQRLLKLQHALQKGGPVLLLNLAQEIIQGVSDPTAPLIALVDLANKAKSGTRSQPLLPARYHVFIRAIEGAYLRLSPDIQLFLDRYETFKEKGREYPVFEISSCRQCGAVYLSGFTEIGENNRRYFKQCIGSTHLEQYLLLDLGKEPVEEENEDEIVGFPENIVDEAGKYERYILCGSCGSIDKDNAIDNNCCRERTPFSLLKVPVKEGKVYACPACGRRSSQGVVWRFLTGADAATSVLVTSLYREIEPRQAAKGTNIRAQDDPWRSYHIDVDAADKGYSSRAQRKLLAFSDSRQDAAFFAPYLNRTYSRILRRGLILKILEINRDAVLNDKWRVQDIVNPLQKYIENNMELFPDYSKTEQKTEIWKWLMYELLALDKRNSLEGLGLLGFCLVKPQKWMPPKPLLRESWCFTPEELWTLYQVLFDTIRQKGALLFPKEVSPRDEFFQPRNREYYVKERTDRELTKRGVIGWNSSSNNSRSDYLLRLARKVNPDITKEECLELLSNIWRGLGLDDPDSFWNQYFIVDNIPQVGTVFRLKSTVWELRATQLDSSIEWYICDKCKNLTLHNVRGICPTYRCKGTLRKCDPLVTNKGNHYFKLYTDLLPIRMRAEEHTAQLSNKTAAELQNDFINGRINVLSCSTTFELGVNIGELETVFMRNMPPSAANYVQRAGRAGRQTDSVAYVLTFAQRRSHDLAHYQEPGRMVAGIIKPPYFKIENLKIVRRHLYAAALSYFWRERPDYFGTVDDFFFQNEVPGPKCFAEFLDEKPQALKEALKRIVPQELHDELQLENWGWVRALCQEEDAVLLKAWEEIASDMEQLEQLSIKLFQEKRGVDHINRLISTIKGKNLIEYLSTRNVIPKYGFPVDVVELQLTHHGEEARRLQLERDLRIALSEYAPSSQVVAGGKLWTSRYLKRLPKKEWERYRYAICDKCNSYYRGSRVEFDEQRHESEALKVCPVCGQVIRNRGVFIIPAFGFISDRQAPGEPGEERPERTYTTRVYYSGCDNKGESVSLGLNGSQLTVTPASKGKLAIINNAGGKAFKVCFRCGYTLIGDEKAPRKHQNAWGSECNGTLIDRLALGHEFETDILMMAFEGYRDNRKSFWLSMLYGILEGTCEVLQIERQDLDGCMYYSAGNLEQPVLVLFDDVPGGAGHVRRLANVKVLLEVLKATLERLKRCECGAPEGNTSCYGCLRHFRNQYCHDELNRGMVIGFLQKALSI